MVARALRVGSVSLMTGLAVQTIYNKVSRGEFPRPYKPSSNRAIWYEEDIMRWIKSTIGDIHDKSVGTDQR